MRKKAAVFIPGHHLSKRRHFISPLTSSQFNEQTAVKRDKNKGYCIKGCTGGSLAWFTNRKDSKLCITDMKIAFSQITKINKSGNFLVTFSYAGKSV